MIDITTRLNHHRTIGTQDRETIRTVHEHLISGRISEGFTVLESIPGAVMPEVKTHETLQDAIAQTINCLLKVGYDG